MQVDEDDYYAEILIEIDGWTWNLKDRVRARFPEAERILSEWQQRERKPRLR